MKKQIKISYRAWKEIFRAVEYSIVFTRLGTKEHSTFCKSYNYIQSAKFIKAHMDYHPFRSEKKQ